MKPKINLIISMLIFGSIGLFVRGINLSSAEIALVRGVLGTLFLLIASIAMKKSISLQSIRKNIKILLLSGITIGGNWILLFEAYKYTTIASATLSYYLAPVFVILLSPIVFKDKLRFKQIICIISSLIGMAMVADIFTKSDQGSNNTLGILFGISAALLYAIVMLANKFLKDLSPIETTAAQLGIASIVLLPYTLISQTGLTFKIDSKTIILLLIVGILHTGVGYLLYFSSMQKLKVQTVAVFSYIDPITAIFFSAILLQEKMNFLQILGAFLILGSTLVNEIYDKED